MQFDPIPVPEGFDVESVGAADIAVVVTQGLDGQVFQFLPHASAFDVTALTKLIEAFYGPPEPSDEQVALTNAWLTVKACLESLPPVPEEGVDPHAASRARLSAEVQSALDALESAGGPG